MDNLQTVQNMRNEIEQLKKERLELANIIADSYCDLLIIGGKEFDMAYEIMEESKWTDIIMIIK